MDVSTVIPAPSERLLESIDLDRMSLSRKLDAASQAQLGQFMTPVLVARQLASMFRPISGEVRLLDAGAGIGSLGAALIARLLVAEEPPTSIHLCAYEISKAMWPGLERTVDALESLCSRAHVDFVAEIFLEDFLAAGIDEIEHGILPGSGGPFDAVILNPPYRKTGTGSRERSLCQRIGLETPNLYTAFLAVASGLLQEGGQLAAIVPRSFTNGSYFRPFREWFGRSMMFDGFHLYESRNSAFAADGVLQENVLVAATKTLDPPRTVKITSSRDPSDHHLSYRDIPYGQLIRADDPSEVIHLVADEVNHRVAERVGSLPAELADLGLVVSTGRVVDFRARGHLRDDMGPSTVPLIYPGHIRAGRISWPMASSRKPNALVHDAKSEGLLVPEGLYVLTKRFSAKEERRRIIAALYDPGDVAGGCVGFENHLNYFHDNGKGLERGVALGLRAYLNSTLVDLYFRQFSGHTQVNAGDLRRMRYPSREQLCRLAECLGEALPEQEELDRILDEELFAMAEKQQSDPVRTARRIEDGVSILRELGLPRAQLNERSGLTLLALLDVGPDDPWSAVSDPLLGITPMMDFFRGRYGKTYAPNTRESVRRQTVHQFLNAGLVVVNPDCPDRPPNSPKTVYQIEASALELIRTYGMPKWKTDLDTYLASRQTLREMYAAERAMARIPVTLPNGGTLSLTGGGQNILVKEVITEFCSRWTPEGELLYVGDAGEKFAYVDTDALHDLGIDIEQHGKMPDLLVHDVPRDWLVVIEAVTSHGPVDPKRLGELKALFGSSKVPLVYVTAFLDRRAMARWVPEIAWETEVWCASDPTHLIHFNGERHLGPYDA